MFAKPRPKKSPLPPLPSKKRKSQSQVEEIAFDTDARKEYLTGFHKRKQQRIKHAQEEASKRIRQEKLEARQQMRQDRRREVEEHVEHVNRMLKESGAVATDIHQDSSDETADEWDGFPDRPNLEIIDHEEEYIDEDRYTTVTVESVSVSRDGFGKLGDEDTHDGDEDTTTAEKLAKERETDVKQATRKKQAKKKFRYESKHERKFTERKQRAINKSRRRG